MADDKVKGDKKGKAPKKTESVEVVEEYDDGAPQTISLLLAVAFIVGALVVGLVLGYVVAPKSSGVDDLNTTGAPQLTPQQLQGGLPPSHPPLPSGNTTGTTGGETTGAPQDGAPAGP